MKACLSWALSEGEGAYSQCVNLPLHPFFFSEAHPELCLRFPELWPLVLPSQRLNPRLGCGQKYPTEHGEEGLNIRFHLLPHLYPASWGAGARIPETGAHGQVCAAYVFVQFECLIIASLPLALDPAFWSQLLTTHRSAFQLPKFSILSSLQFLWVYTFKYGSISPSLLSFSEIKKGVVVNICIQPSYLCRSPSCSLLFFFLNMFSGSTLSNSLFTMLEKLLSPPDAVCWPGLPKARAVCGSCTG